jgi:hypothetical protein
MRVKHGKANRNHNIFLIFLADVVDNHSNPATEEAEDVGSQVNCFPSEKALQRYHLERVGIY